MTPEQKEYLQATINNEGLDYALFDYTSWDNPLKSHYIDDLEFQDLYSKVYQYRQRLIQYLKSQGLTNLH